MCMCIYIYRLIDIDLDICIYNTPVCEQRHGHFVLCTHEQVYIYVCICTYIYMDCGGQPPHTWHDGLCGFFETLFQRRVDGLKPASTCLWTVPRAQALLRERVWVAQLWAKSVGAVRLRALPLFWCSRGVSVSV